MGKSSTAAMFRELLGADAVLDSDAIVHDLYSPGGAAVSPIEAAFPGVTDATGAISRPLLSPKVLGHPEALALLESIVHPLVREEKRKFIAAGVARAAPLLVLDIPLLYETNLQGDCDAVAVVSAPASVQNQRALARPGMTVEKLQGILARQVPDIEKRKQADFVIDTSVSLEETRKHVESIVAGVQGRHGVAYKKYIV